MIVLPNVCVFFLVFVNHVVCFVCTQRRDGAWGEVIATLRALKLDPARYVKMEVLLTHPDGKQPTRAELDTMETRAVVLCGGIEADNVTNARYGSGSGLFTKNKAVNSKRGAVSVKENRLCCWKIIQIVCITVRL
jgi:hypothetical protein